jgi:hypothetical protein
MAVYPATQRAATKQSSTTGNLADIGKALRAAREARREDMEQQAETFQSPMFDLRGLANCEGRVAATAPLLLSG